MLAATNGKDGLNRRVEASLTRMRTVHLEGKMIRLLLISGAKVLRFPDYNL